MPQTEHHEAPPRTASIEPTANDRHNVYLYAGWVLTLVWLTITISIWIFTRDATGFNGTPNEIGDFIAGMFAPLAFVWIVVAALVQSQELRAQQFELQQNGKSLQMQAAELKNTVSEMKTQTEQLKRSTDAQIRTVLASELNAARIRLCDALLIDSTKIEATFFRQDNYSKCRKLSFHSDANFYAELSKLASESNFFTFFTKYEETLQRMNINISTLVSDKKYHFAEDAEETIIQACERLLAHINVYQADTEEILSEQLRSRDLAEQKIATTKKTAIETVSAIRKTEKTPISTQDNRC